MQVHHKPTKILIVGMSGSGKTTYLLRYVQHSKEHVTVFIFDHKGEFEERLGVVPCFSLQECATKLSEGQRFISYHYADEYPGDSEIAFQAFSDWAFRMSRILREDGKSRIFAVDEVNRFTGTSDMGHDFRQLIEDGRLQGLDFIGTSHAANQIHNRLRLQLSEIVALRTKDPRPLAFLEENGFDVEEVKSLATGEFISKNLEDDSFSRGKLFSGQAIEKPVNAGNDSGKPPENLPEITNHALPSSLSNSDTVHGNPESVE